MFQVIEFAPVAAFRIHEKTFKSILEAKKYISNEIEEMKEYYDIISVDFFSENETVIHHKDGSDGGFLILETSRTSE